jgi:membrane protein YdbS with pleckstrin-like domain
MYEEYRENQRCLALAAGETILWRGKPKKGPFIASRSLTMLPIAVIWLILDMSFITSAFRGGEMLMFLIPFFALHLMPVWIWLGSTITAGKRWKNTMYYVTNRRIIIQSGFLAVNEKSVFYKDIRNAQLQIGIFDKFAGTGSIVLDDGYYDYRNKRNHPGTKLENLEDAQSAYSRIQQTILDIQTDIEYPNAYRPEHNPGYQTDYRP